MGTPYFLPNFRRHINLLCDFLIDALGEEALPKGEQILPIGVDYDNKGRKSENFQS